jgi:hypothetical protein
MAVAREGGLRVAVNLGKQVGVELNLGKSLGARGDVGQAGVEVLQKCVHIKPQMMWGVGLEVAMHAAMQFSGAADVAISKMVERHGRLDQPLVELPRCAAVFRPEFLPNLVAFVIIALVELLDAREVQGLVVVGIRRHPQPASSGLFPRSPSASRPDGKLHES